jgi:hypothetical protein
VSCVDIGAEGRGKAGGVAGGRPAVGGEGRHQAPNGAVLCIWVQYYCSARQVWIAVGHVDMHTKQTRRQRRARCLTRDVGVLVVKGCSTASEAMTRMPRASEVVRARGLGPTRPSRVSPTRARTV